MIRTLSNKEDTTNWQDWSKVWWTSFCHCRVCHWMVLIDADWSSGTSKDPWWSMKQSTRPGKRLHNYGKSQWLMGKRTISMAIFNSYVSHYQRVSQLRKPTAIFGLSLNFENPWSNHACSEGIGGIPFSHLAATLATLATLVEPWRSGCSSHPLSILPSGND